MIPLAFHVPLLNGAGAFASTFGEPPSMSIRLSYHRQKNQLICRPATRRDPKQTLLTLTAGPIANRRSAAITATGLQIRLRTQSSVRRGKSPPTLAANSAPSLFQGAFRLAPRATPAA